jgi:hypothetical protein
LKLSQGRCTPRLQMADQREETKANSTPCCTISKTARRAWAHLRRGEPGSIQMRWVLKTYNRVHVWNAADTATPSCREPCIRVVQAMGCRPGHTMQCARNDLETMARAELARRNSRRVHCHTRHPHVVTKRLLPVGTLTCPRTHSPTAWHRGVPASTKRDSLRVHFTITVQDGSSP